MAQRKFAQELQPNLSKKKQPKECIFLIKFEENTSVNYSFHEGAKQNNKSTVNSNQTTLPEATQGKGVVTFC